MGSCDMHYPHRSDMRAIPGRAARPGLRPPSLASDAEALRRAWCGQPVDLVLTEMAEEVLSFAETLRFVARRVRGRAELRIVFPDGFGWRLQQKAVQAAQFALAVLRQVSPAAARGAELYIEGPDAGPEPARRLGIPVHWDAEGNRLVFAVTPDLPFDIPEVARPVFPGDLSISAIAAGGIRTRLGTGQLAIGDVADSLGMPRWTLQRRLTAEGLSFSALVDRLRRQLAREYLADQRFSVTAIAFALGYSETSAFSRACRRWFDASPRDVRSRTALL